VTTLRPVKAGDIGETRTVGLRETIGTTVTAVNLSAATQVLCRLRRGRQTATLPCTILDAATGLVEVDCGTDEEYDWLPSRPDTGEWLVEFEVTYIDGTVLTWPNDGYDIIEVFSDLDPLS
jgi:hypothetical protein